MNVAIVLVMITGFFNSPSSVARSVLLQRNTPREMRGRVFSAFYVMRDIIFLLGMAGAGIADYVDLRLLVIVASSLLFVSAAFVLVAPGLSIGTWRAASARLAAAEAATVGVAVARPALAADFDRLVGRLTTFGRLDAAGREAFLREATVTEVPAGTRVVGHGETASSAYFILDGSATAGIPLPDGGHRGLSTMVAGDFFGEIAALTGSARTADVVADSDTTLLEVPADALRATMVVPEIQKLVLSTLTSRLVRTESADLPRLAGLDQARSRSCVRRARASRPCRSPTPAKAPAEQRACGPVAQLTDRRSGQVFRSGRD